MKTKLFTLFTVCLTFASAHGQTADDHAALKNLIGQERYDHIAEIGQERIDAMAYINKHGYYISDMQGEKDISEYPNALEVPPIYPSSPALTIEMISSGNLDLLGYRFGDSQNTYGYYKVGDSDKLLVILPMEIILGQLNTKKEL
jgi:hypothetical protein